MYLLFPSHGVGVHIRKAFGYVFSARLNYMQGIGKGLNWQPQEIIRNNVAWADRYNVRQLMMFTTTTNHRA